MPAIGTGAGKTAKNEPRGVTRKPAPPTKSPAGDRAGATGIAKANDFKRTPAYRKAIRDTYKEQPVAARRVIARNVAKTAAPAPKKRPIDRAGIAAYKALPKAQRASVDAALRRLTAARLGARSTATTISRVHEQRHATDLAQLNELGFLAREKYGYTPKVTKTNVMPDDSAVRAKELGWTPEQYKKNKAVLDRHPEKEGFKPEGRLGKAIALPALVIPGAAKSAGALAEATYKDPVGVPTKTAKQLALATAAVVPGLVKTAIHPVQTGKDIVDSMYESYAEPYDKKVAHIRTEGGLQDAINVASVLAPTSKALALGKFGPVERAGLRVSGGLVKARKPRSGLLSGLAGQAIDNAKARRYERLAEADKPLTGQQRAALNANRAAGRTVEVVPNRVKGKVIRDVAKLRGRSVNELHYDLAKGDFGQAAKKLGKLDKHEKKALWFSAAGVRTAQQAVDLLPALKQKILDARGDKAPKGRYRKMDMVKRIDEILADPQKHFTQHLDEVMNDVAQHVEAISARDPRYAELTKEARRRADRNVLLNIEQGVLPSAFNGRRIIADVAAKRAAEPLVRTKVGEKKYEFTAPAPAFDAATLKSIQRNNRKAAAAPYGVRKVADPAAYDPAPAAINERQWFHGTSAHGLTEKTLDGNQTMPDSLFGQGVYLTSDRGIAGGYAKNRTANKRPEIIGRDKNGYAILGKDPKPALYGAQVKTDKVLDLEAPFNEGLGQVFHSQLNAVAKGLGEMASHRDPDLFIVDEMRKGIESGAVKTSADLYDAFREALGEMSQDYGWSRGDVWEHLGDLQGNLRKAGIDALTHVGGRRVAGSHAHQVLILLDPGDLTQHGRPNQARHFGPSHTPARTDKAARRVAASDQPPPPKGGALTVGKYSNAPKASDPVRDALKATHPDHGGNAEDFIDVQAAAGTLRHTIPPLRYADESDADFQARADNLAEARGLRSPMYFKSERHRGEQADHSAFAVGGGRAMAYEGKHEGRNLRKGVLDMSERAFLRGYARNVKAAHNWPLVANMIERHSYEDLTPGPGVDVGQALDAINEATPEIKPGDVSLINPGIFRKHLEQHVDETKGSEGLPEDLGAQNVLDAMSAATLEHGVQQIPAEFQKTNGWKAVPTSMLRELEAEMKAGTKGGRYLDIAKGKASRAILLTANVPWLAIQAVSEGSVTALATKGSALNPVNWLGTRSWWKNMTHEQRQEVSGVLGLNATSADLKQTRLGAVSSGGFVNAWRALKEAPVWHKDRKWLAGHGISELNPAELMAAADRGKTNVTRLLLAHSELKKAAVADMAEGMAAHEKATTRLMHVFQQPVAKQYETLRENPHLLEDVGETLNKWLGDWTTMTAAERKIVNRMVMFWPYVRYATRLLFYTLPVEHPLVASALAEIGQLTQTEYHEIFGDDDLPWNIGKVYFGKTGESKYIDLARGNPLMTAATSAFSRVGSSSSNIPGAVVGSLPPYGQWLVDNLTGVNTFAGRPLRLNGDTDPFYNKPWEIGLDAHGKLILAEVQSLFYPAREAMSRLHPGTQSDESSLLFPTPMKYKRSDQIAGNGEDAIIRRATAKNAETNDKFARENDGGLAGLVLGPLLPTPSRDAASSKEREYVKKLKAKQAKGAAERKRYRDSHGGKNKPKPGGAGNSGFGGSSGNSAF